MRPALYNSTAAPPVELIPRLPLPRFDHDSVDAQTGAPLPVYTTLREPPPPTADVAWWRGDAWAITISDLPPVDGGASGPASPFLTSFLDRYGSKWEDKSFAPISSAATPIFR